MDDVADFQEPAQREKIERLAELYRLAGLIYLLRAVMALPSSSPEVAKYVDLAFGILEGLDTCERAFPLFIIACEARCDGRRRQILDLISRTQDHRYSGSLVCARRIVEAAWAQDDLHPERNIDCGLKFTAVISSYMSLPMFT
jgi:hypothetical protein